MIVSIMFKWFQSIGAEIEGNLRLLELQLENVEGGKMEVKLTFSSLLIQNKLLTICETLRLCLLFPKTCRCTGSVLSTGWQAGKCQIWSKKPSFRSNHFVSGAFVIFFLILVIIVVHHWKWSSCSGGWVGAKARPWGSARPTFNLLSGYKISWFSWICYLKREQNNQTFPLQAVESESPGLVPIGLLVHWTFLLISCSF